MIFSRLFDGKSMEDIAMENMTKMLNERGYGILESDKTKMLAENEEGHRILVILPDDVKINMSTIKEITSILKDNDLQHCILLYKESITASAKKIIETLPHYTIETFSVDEMQYNRIDHRLVPLHEKLEDSYLKIIKKKYGAKLPVMLSTDAIAQYYKFDKGDIIRVSRLDGSIAYRIVR